MGVPKEKELTREEMFQADRLAKLQFAEIKHDRSAVSELSRAFEDIPRHLVPCNYGRDVMTSFTPNYRFIGPVLKILSDIRDGKIVLVDETLITEKNEIKKMLYKEKPTAKRFQRLAKSITYVTNLSNGQSITFKVPKEESVDFDKEIPAQLLIRWMV